MKQKIKDRLPQPKQLGRIDEEGYRIIYLEGYGEYHAEDIAWCLVTGDWPPRKVIHIDGNHDNNRWANLKLADEILTVLGENQC